VAGASDVGGSTIWIAAEAMRRIHDEIFFTGVGAWR